MSSEPQPSLPSSLPQHSENPSLSCPPIQASLAVAMQTTTPAPLAEPSNSQISSHPPEKRKRDALSLREKARIIRMLQETGQSRRALARELQIPRATMHSIWKNKDLILSKTNSLPEHSLGNIKRCRPPQYPDLEDRVYAFCLFVRSHRKPIAKSLIIAKARKIASEMGITGFAASNGWYTKFLRRRGLPQTGRPKTVEGDPISLDTHLADIKTQLLSFSSHNIYTVEESRFLYRCLPNRAFLSNAETGRGATSASYLSNTPTITFNICTNATGSHTLPIMFVAKERHPVSFDLADAEDSVADHYYSQPNAWMDHNLFEIWVRSWYDSVRTISSPPWALVLTSNEANDKLPTLPGVTYILLPYTGANKHQPMSNGIITSVKASARKHLLNSIIRALESEEQFLSVASTLRPGAAGIVYGRKATILDAMRVLTAGLRDLRNDHIAACWLKSGILPDTHEAALADHAARLPIEEPTDAMELNSLLSKLSQTMEDHNLRRDFEREFGNFDVLPADTVDRWIDFLISNEDQIRHTSGTIGDSLEEILAASEIAEKAAAVRQVATPNGEAADAIPPERTAAQRLQAAHASAAVAVKIVQTSLNEVSLHSTNHAVLGKLAEALRLATEDRNEKRRRMEVHGNLTNAPS